MIMDGRWKLKRIDLRFKDFGKDVGKYAGFIEFENGDDESFKFKIKPDMASKYIELLASDIVSGADCLANDLVKSLGLVNKGDSE